MVDVRSVQSPGVPGDPLEASDDPSVDLDQFLGAPAPEELPETRAAEVAAVNPKDLIGVSKVPLSLNPPVALAHMAIAMLDGRTKYGLFNWREYPVRSDIYLDAMLRHASDYADGENEAGDSSAHHLGHVMACCAILLDAEACGNLVDTRPKPGQAAAVFEALRPKVTALIERAVEKEDDA